MNRYSDLYLYVGRRSKMAPNDTLDFGIPY
jgi:hypothetical protein